MNIAFTGHRPDRLPWHGSLTLPHRIRRALQRHARAPKNPPTLLCNMGPGTDLMAIRVALRLGWSVQALLPASEDVTLAAFASARERKKFRALIKKYKSVEIVSQDAQAPDYLAAGLAMLERADLLIAVYDGKGSRGPGGTADLMDPLVRKVFPFR